MESVVITELVNTVGFPITVAIALFWQNYKNQENYNKTFAEFKDVINHNSRSIEQLTEIVKEMNNTGGNR